MTYWLGIDLGTTYTAAALCRPAVDELETHVVPLGSRSPAVPSVLFLAGDGSLVVGEGAERRALTDPDRVVREFKRRIGDEIPLLVGGVPWPAHELAAVLVHWVWQRATEREGELPEGIALTCPASWGPHKIRLFMQAVQATRIGEMTRLGRAELLSEPQAAAIGYASRERVEVGAHLAVYDLGGGTFDAAVVRKDSPTAFTVLGRPEGIDRLGGVTFDEMLFEHVCAAAGVPLTRIDPNDPNIFPRSPGCVFLLCHVADGPDVHVPQVVAVGAVVVVPVRACDVVQVLDGSVNAAVSRAQHDRRRGGVAAGQLDEAVVRHQRQRLVDIRSRHASEAVGGQHLLGARAELRLSLRIFQHVQDEVQQRGRSGHRSYFLDIAR